MIIRFALLGTAVLALTACGGKTSAGPQRTTGSTGVMGTATVSPGQNTCPATRSCGKPAAGLTIQFSQNGQPVITTKTGKDGSYRVSLPKGGNYAIDVRGVRGVAPEVKPTAVTVSEGEFKQLDLVVDIGIR
jgi:hypothetical protein